MAPACLRCPASYKSTAFPPARDSRMTRGSFPRRRWMGCRQAVEARTNDRSGFARTLRLQNGSVESDEMPDARHSRSLRQHYLDQVLGYLSGASARLRRPPRANEQESRTAVSAMQD